MRSFAYTANPSRVVFGPGSLQQLGAEIERLGAHRALVLSTPEQVDSARRVAELLGDRAAGLFPHAAMHVPLDESLQLAPVAHHESRSHIAPIAGRAVHTRVELGQ